MVVSSSYEEGQGYVAKYGVMNPNVGTSQTHDNEYVKMFNLYWQMNSLLKKSLLDSREPGIKMEFYNKLM